MPTFFTPPSHQDSGVSNDVSNKELYLNLIETLEDPVELIVSPTDNLEPKEEGEASFSHLKTSQKPPFEPQPKMVTGDQKAAQMYIFTNFGYDINSFDYASKP